MVYFRTYLEHNIWLRMNNKQVKYRTGFLVPRNNFLVGMGSVLNLMGNYFEYNYSKSDFAADNKALISDWLNVGNDFQMVLIEL